MITALTIGSILVGLGIVVFLLLYLARPFVFPEDDWVRHDREEVDALLLRKQDLLRQIRELDDDMESDKVAPEMYHHTRPQLVKQAAIVMQQLDAHGYQEMTPVAYESTNDQIEAAVRQLRIPREIDAAIEDAIRQTRSAAKPATTGRANFCPQCGRAVEAGDRFCAGCGHSLMPQTPVAEATEAS